MIKQAKAIGFIIVANILLLAHSFIPHQHSNCFVSFENQYRIHHDDHDHSSKPYHHNETDNSEKEDHEGCVLKFDFIVKIKPDFEYTYVGNHWNIPDHSLLFNYEGSGMAAQPFSSIISTRGLNSFYCVCVFRCFGLRAPPLA